MKRPALIWTCFGAAVTLVLAVMLFFTVKMLSFERSMAQAQARAVLEENVRLALWRMDSAAAVLLAEGGGEPKTFPGNVATQQAFVNDPQQRFQTAVQSKISVQEFEQRSALNSQRELEPEHPQNWRSIEPVLLERIRDIIPGATLQPVVAKSDPAGDTRRLASIPARLVVPPSAMPPTDLPWYTPLRISLIVAWACVLLAAVAVGSLLATTLALSERRGAFASAVTHELRTPLTTIRMYGEMLSGGMVADDLARRQYLDTLVAESDRLGHMVENVLAYARLEKRLSPRRAEVLTVRELLERTLPTLERRVAQANLALRVHLPADVASIPCRTDPVGVQQVLLNLVDNACKFGRTDVELSCAAGPRAVSIRVSDRGPGLGRRAASLFTAFGKSRSDPIPGIGLGLYLSRQLARDTGGDLRHEPTAAGAAFTLVLSRADAV